MRPTLDAADPESVDWARVKAVAFECILQVCVVMEQLMLWLGGLDKVRTTDRVEEKRYPAKYGKD